VQNLKERIERFIRSFNETVAKPFRWTKTDKPLAACSAGNGSAASGEMYQFDWPAIVWDQ